MSTPQEQLFIRIRRLPVELRRYIAQFVPVVSPPKWPNNTQTQIQKLQNSPKRTAMDLKGLDDFVLKQ
jgi:hypothetical protein